MQRKFKTMIWILGVCLIAATVIVACEEMEMKENNGKDGKIALGPLATGASATKWWEVDKQIEWIAKGLVYVADDISGFKKLVHNECKVDSYNELKTADAHLQSDAQLSYDLQAGHKGFLDSNFPSNNYDQLFFGGFEIDGDEYYNFIWIPEIDSIDSNDIHVICPIRSNEVRTDSSTGFFLDSLGNLDSLVVNWGNDPWNEYYIWVVNYDTEIPQAPISGGWSDRGCGDGVCDQTTEDEISCPQDCDPSYGGGQPIKNVYKIFLKDIEVYNDEKKYFESSINGKYEFVFVGATFEGNGDATSSRGDYTENCGESLFALNVTKVKLRESCRVKNNGNCKNASEVITINEIIVEEIHEDMKFAILCYERDGMWHRLLNEKFIVELPNTTAVGCSEEVKFLVNIARKNISVNPDYNESSNPSPNSPMANRNVVEWDNNDYVDLQALFTAGTLLIDNGEYRYTLEAQLK